MTKKTCGIYKITSPVGRVYIGQSRNIEHRFISYKRSCSANKTQIRLDRSFKKHGVTTHIFEIIESCFFENLNKRERYWQDFYDVLNGGLNCILVETDELPRIITDEHRDNISGKNHWLYGKQHSLETRRKMSISAKNKPPMSGKTKQKLRELNTGDNNTYYGKHHTDEIRKQMSNSAKKRKTTIENEKKRRDGISIGHLGKKLTATHVEKIRNGKLGSNNPNFGKKWITNETINKLIDKNLELPVGFRYGKIHKQK
jgi:hypothetical protein